MRQEPDPEAQRELRLPLAINTGEILQKNPPFVGGIIITTQPISEAEPSTQVEHKGAQSINILDAYAVVFRAEISQLAINIS